MFLSCLVLLAGLTAPPLQGTDPGSERVAKLALPGMEIVAVEVRPAGSFQPPVKAFAAEHLPPFCRIAVVMRPTPDSNIKIEVWLPAPDKWNGRLLGTGNGGGAGRISYPALAGGLRLGYATANTDLGTSPAAEQVVAHPERWANFGSTGTHEMTVAAKAIIGAYYGRPAAHTYFIGGSTGGQQALVEAQRYPEDYNGIIAGAPAINRTHLHAMFLWDWQALRQRPGSALAPDKIALVIRSEIQEVGGKDGGAPGDDFLSDPRMCHFDPESLRPQLSAEQVAALKRIYAGPSNPRTGEQIFTPPPYGSERLIGLSAENENVPHIYPYVFMWAMPGRFDPAKFDFDRDLDAMDRKEAAILNANNPDLTGFQNRGGKLLMFSGTADAIVPFQDEVNYYERVARAQGGLDRTQAFFRFYVVPGMAHVAGGPGLNEFGQGIFRGAPRGDSDHDLFTALIKWVEEGVAPERIIATAYVGGASPHPIRFQRPIYPYPKFPEYIGGDVKSPASYRGVDHERGGVAQPAERYLN